ncbi:6-phosphofructo-2-kinase/fructose-2,6-bisphosphatase [Platanthera zijinensis]|uniref:6-phosphofructo-2-kinase/fructose-2, 6-bisphosphatase n=1 Tax=Platanthera zijinensis TaxID=2320716 RepID=A0AAP0G9L2_9ASPA
MGGSSSRSPSISHASVGGQLYVSLKMEYFKIGDELIPHVFGSVPIIGSWDPARARRMERESASMWELSFVVPPNHETLHFLFLLKPDERDVPFVVEEGPDRLLTRGNLEGDARPAVFRPPELGDKAIPEYKVFMKVDVVSPFDLAASWRAYQENLRPSTVRGIPDISINVASEGGHEAMPAATGAVVAAAVADQMHGPKEDRRLAIVLVGLPARGKTFTAAKLTRYLQWLGHETKHFNVGKYRRLKHGSNQPADFFRGDNPEGMEARNEVAALAMEDMLSWMQGGGQVGIFDATNSSRQRRNMLMKMSEGNCKIIFLETICNDELIIERNIRLKIQQSPDYEEETDFEAGLRDFKERLANYDKVYDPVDEGSYIKMIDMVSGQGGQIQINNISGYLPGRIVFFLVNTHLTPRPILLTRHGESQDNVRGRIGGDSVLSETGDLYSEKLAKFVEERLKSERTASIWTSTLQRTIMTATPIVELPKIQWRALDEINAGVCDGMAYEEIKRNMPEEYESRKKDKLRYRYPRGESYLDVIQRLEPVIIELERQRAPVVVISHQAVLRALYAYFADRPLKEIPHIEVPLHTVIEIQMGVTGVQEKRYKLMD